jgi:hypothetical protein
MAFGIANLHVISLARCVSKENGCSHRRGLLKGVHEIFLVFARFFIRFGINTRSDFHKNRDAEFLANMKVIIYLRP